LGIVLDVVSIFVYIYICCSKKKAEIADFFLVDTSPFYLKYWNSSKYDWRNVSPRDTYIETLLKV
jgi:hypothetical protein